MQMFAKLVGRIICNNFACVQTFRKSIFSSREGNIYVMWNSNRSTKVVSVQKNRFLDWQVDFLSAHLSINL